MLMYYIMHILTDRKSENKHAKFAVSCLSKFYCYYVASKFHQRRALTDYTANP